MKKITCLFLIAIFIVLSCSQNDNEPKNAIYPECISIKIQGILQSPVQNPKAKIQKYNYNGFFVYAINFIKNDGASLEVYNDKCELICSTGSTIDGTPFNSCIDWNKATLIETVWSDPR